MNAFDLFGLPFQFKLDTAQLRKSFLSLSGQIHPDRNPDLLAEEAGRRTSELNAAYEILRNPDKRLEHILELSGALGPASEREKTPIQLPPGFLMETMEINEALMEADSPEARTKVEAEVQAIVEALDSERDAATEQGDALGYLGDSEEVQKIKTKLLEIYAKRKYALRLQAQVRNFAAR